MNSLSNERHSEVIFVGLAPVLRNEESLLFTGSGNERRLRSPVALAAKLVVACAFLSAWELGVSRGYLDPFFYSQPSAIAAELVGWFSSGYIWQHIWVTFGETILGFTLGTLGGVFLGFLLGRSLLLGDVFEPFIALFNGIPRIVLAPLLLLWLGIGIESKVALASTVIFPIVFYAVFTGIREVDQALIDNARVLGAQRKDIIVSVLLPSSLSWIFSSLRVSVGFAVGAAVVAEYMGSNEGLGFVISNSFAYFQATGGFAAMLLLLGIVIALNFVIDRVSSRLMAWKL